MLCRSMLVIVEQFVDALILIGLTLFGGLQFLNWNLGRLIDNELLRQLALLASVLLILGALGLPFSLWRKFKLEARFGFNRVTPRLFVMDALKGLLVSVALGLPLAAAVLWIMANRSEEHTSELQSLMRISYAVFCLKKKTKDTR